MQSPEWEKRISRRSWLLAGLAIPLSRAWAWDPPLNVTFDGDNLHIAAPDLHFLSGKAFDRLKNADTVSFLSQITVLADERGTLFRPPTRERVIVSYDLWEERFSVTIPGSARRSQSHLMAPKAEAWVIESLAVSALGLAPDRPFWLRFDLQAVTQRELTRVMGDSGLSLNGLIDFLSRKPGSNDLRWSRSAGPLVLSTLPRIRGTRNG
jgi:hypothetical protein